MQLHLGPACEGSQSPRKMHVHLGPACDGDDRFFLRIYANEMGSAVFWCDFVVGESATFLVVLEVGMQLWSQGISSSRVSRPVWSHPVLAQCVSFSSS